MKAVQPIFWKTCIYGKDILRILIIPFPIFSNSANYLPPILKTLCEDKKDGYQKKLNLESLHFPFINNPRVKKIWLLSISLWQPWGWGTAAACLAEVIYL